LVLVLNSVLSKSKYRRGFSPSILIKYFNLRRIKMSEEKGFANGFLLGILAGGITGGLIALLYAPKSGLELRKDISDKKNELIEDAEQYYTNAKVKANEILTDGKRKAEELVEDAKRKANEISSTGKEKISKIKDALKSGIDAYNEERDRKYSEADEIPSDTKR